jgi:DNA-binding response OmpR family regulator
MTALATAPSARPRFETAEAILFDPVAANRSATRGMLASLGFRKVQTPFDLQALSQRLKGQAFDLILLEMRPDPKPLLSLIQELRQGRIGLNPFSIVMATAWTLDDEVVRGVVQSGADDLMGRPFSTGFLGQRLKNLIDGRKGFVVTSDYVGPDRRRDPNRTGGAPTSDVPNSLKAKSLGRTDTIAVEMEIAQAIARSKVEINLEKARRNAFQMIIQAKLTGAALEGATPTENIVADLRKIEGLAAETVRLTQASPFSMSYQMCDPIIQASQAAQKGEEMAHHLSLIAQLGTTLFATINPGKTTDEIDFQVTQTIVMIQNRAKGAGSGTALAVPAK